MSMCFGGNADAATPGATYIYIYIHTRCTVRRLLIGKSPLIWTRFIRDSIVCVNAAIENLRRRDDAGGLGHTSALLEGTQKVISFRNFYTLSLATNQESVYVIISSLRLVKGELILIGVHLGRFTLGFIIVVLVLAQMRSFHEIQKGCLPVDEGESCFFFTK